MKSSFWVKALFSFSLLGSVPLWAGTITVNNGAALKGTGNILGDLVVNSGGAVEPWPTCLSVSHADFSAGSELQVSIEGNEPCVNQSQLIVNGEVNLNDANLVATTNNYTLQTWDEYIFIDNDNDDDILSPFIDIDENSTYTIDGELLYASYFAGDGNDFSLLFKFIYPIGGTVSGLAPGNEVFLQNGSGEITSIDSNGDYQFSTPLDDGSSYSVSVVNQPSTPNQTCTLSNASGTVSGDPVTDINVTCVTNSYPVGGTVLGLAAGNEVVVLNNAGDVQVLNSNGGFVFSTNITDETMYNVSVSANPTSPNQSCTVFNGSGTVMGAAVTDVVIDCVTNTYSVGGTISGLANGNSVTLQNNAGDDLIVNANGSFDFATEIIDEGAYSVSVLTQPTTPNQTCTVSQGSGSVSGAVVTDVNITCVTNTYTIGGNVTGLAAGSQLTLQNNLSNDLIVAANGGFVFATSLTDETGYDIQVSVNPSNPNQTCSVMNGMGTVMGDHVSDVVVSCVTNTYSIGGQVAGLAAGNSVVLQNSLADDLLINADGPFTFSNEVLDGGNYEVSVLTQPTTPNQTCTVTQGTGSMAGGPVTNVVVNCETNTYSIGGTISGLANGNSVTLQNNLGDDLIVSANGSFTFATEIMDEGAYAVSVLSQPTSPNQTCTVTQGAGSVAGEPVTNVLVNCETNTYSIGGTISGLANGNSVTLQNNAGDDLIVSANGSFTFATEIMDEGAYAVSVLSQPTSPNQTCTVTQDTGNVSGEAVTTVLVNCDTESYFVGGDVAGLAASNSIELQNNGSDDLVVSNDGVFVFATPIADKTEYDVTVLTQPVSPNQTCEVSNGSGTITGDDVIDVEVDCVTDQYLIGGTANGLLPGEMLELQNNNGDDLMIFSNGAFNFSAPVDDHGAYDVSILSEPTSPIQNCEVLSGQGQVNGSDVSDVIITCDSLDLIFRNGFEEGLMSDSWNE